VRFQQAKICRPHGIATRHALSRSSQVRRRLLFPNLSTSEVRSSMVNALHPPENLGSPPKIHVRQLQHLPTMFRFLLNPGPSFTRSAFDSTLVQHRHEAGLYLPVLLLPQNICFPILDGTTLRSARECSFALFTRACTRRILEPWLLGPTSTHVVEVGSHEGRIRIAGRGESIVIVGTAPTAEYTRDVPIWIWRIRSRNIASTLATASALASAFGFTVSPQSSPLPILTISSIFRGSVLYERLKTSKHGVVGAQTFEMWAASTRINFQILSRICSSPHMPLTSSERTSREFRSMSVTVCNLRIGITDDVQINSDNTR
jgi:hypothetical protein